jgi:hypothetical protein
MTVKICGRQSGREKDLEGKMAITWQLKKYLFKINIMEQVAYNFCWIFMEPEKFFSTTLLLKDLKSLKNVY